MNGAKEKEMVLTIDGKPVALTGFVREIIEAALVRNRWNRFDASRELGISRSTLYRMQKANKQNEPT